MKAHRLSREKMLKRDEWLVEQAKGKSVLHLGCADAPYHHEKARSGNLLHVHLACVAAYILGVDIHPEGVSFLRRELQCQNVVQGDVEALSSLNIGRQFEVVILGELLEHLGNPKRCLDGIPPLLVPGGRLYVTVPNAFAVKSFARVLLGKELVHPDHVAYYSPATITRLLGMAGFRVNRLAYYQSYSLSVGKRLLDAALVGPIRRIAPYTADGLIIEARHSS